MKKHNKKTEHFKLFDNCPMCRSMMHAGYSFEMEPVTKDNLYYDAMDAICDEEYKVAEKFLKRALKMDPDYVQTHVGLIGLYENLKEKIKYRDAILSAFEKTLKVFPRWPREMLWGYLENRAYLRAIQYRADLHIDEGEKEQGIELYKLLLKLNPNDNQGIRYILTKDKRGVRKDS